MSTATTAVIAFNLLCAGTTSSARLDASAHLGLADIVTQNVKFDLRIDLKAGRWCAGSCTSTEAVVQYPHNWLSLAGARFMKHKGELAIDRGTG